MHRFSRPFRIYNPGCAYRRKRKRSSPVWIIIVVIIVFILVCIMPLWLLCSILGLALGFLICLLFHRR